MKRLLAGIVLLTCCLYIGCAEAAEVSLLVTNAFKPVIAEIAPSFERITGHKLSIRADASGILQEEIVRGDNFDVVVLISSNLDSVEKAGKIVPATRAKIARAGLGLVVRSGQSKPDIRTVDGFKDALVKAKSIAYTTRGASGQHFIAVCERLGIADQVRAKGKTMPSGNVAELVAKGEAEVAIQQMSELMAVKGVDVVGALPAEVDLISQISAAVSTGSKNQGAATALVDFLTNAETQKAIKASGMVPG
jgi:molybdate transport system substrate-binding protein